MAVGEAPGLVTANGFAAIPGWADDDHAAAFAAFRVSARRAATSPPKTRALGIDGEAMRAVSRRALELAAQPVGKEARLFFERWFTPARVVAPGFVTAYYEPEVAASDVRTADFPVPLYRRPPDLADVDETNRPPGFDPDMRFARAGDPLTPYLDRPAIESGALAGCGLELAWLRDFVDAFFIHVQGSARLLMADGSVKRIAFAAKSGQAYTSIGRLAVERGHLTAEAADKVGLERWLREHPDEGVALMRENRSFIFFREVPELAPGDGPMGAAGVPLTRGRSLAVDRARMTFHTPVWVDAAGMADMDDPARPFRRLMVAQDTGSAIVGAARGDLFFGSGEAAGKLAGRVRHRAAMTVLVPVPTS